MLNEARRAEARRQAREQFDREYGSEASSSSYPAEPASGDTYAIVQAARAEWERSLALRAEFTSVESYVAFRKAASRGLIKIFAPGRKA
jgi:hypothetical protein